MPTVQQRLLLDIDTQSDHENTQNEKIREARAMGAYKFETPKCKKKRYSTKSTDDDLDYQKKLIQIDLLKVEFELKKTQLYKERTQLQLPATIQIDGKEYFNEFAFENDVIDHLVVDSEAIDNDKEIVVD